MAERKITLCERKHSMSVGEREDTYGTVAIGEGAGDVDGEAEDAAFVRTLRDEVNAVPN